MSRTSTPTDLNEARRALRSAFAANLVCRDELASVGVAGRIATMLNVAEPEPVRGTPGNAALSGRGAAHLVQQAGKRQAGEQAHPQWSQFVDYALSNVLLDGTRGSATFDLPQQRVKLFMASLLVISGEYLVMTRPGGAPLTVRRAVLVVARSAADHARLIPLLAAATSDPHRYWPDLFRLAWTILTQTRHSATATKELG